MQSPLLSNTKESISARVGLGRKRYLGNITKGQFLLTPTNFTVTDRKREIKGLSFAALEKKWEQRVNGHQVSVWQDF